MTTPPGNKDSQGQNKYAPEDATRLLTLATHEEKILNDRTSIFLVVESLLLVFVVRLPEEQTLLLDLVVISGLMITLAWVLTGLRQSMDLACATKAMREAWPLIQEVYAPVPQTLKNTLLLLMIYVLPALFAVIWIAVAFVF